MAESTPQPATSSKRCSSCGVNLDAKPNHKIGSDKYLCPECMEKAKAAKFAMNAKSAPAAAAKATAPADDNSFLLGIGSKTGIAEVGTKPCPECGRALTADSIICTGCGFNTQSGRRTRVRVLKPEKADDGKPKMAAEPIHKNPMVAGTAVALLFIGGSIGMFYEPDVVLPLVLAISLLGFVLWVKVLLLAIQDLGGLFGFLFCLIPFYTVYFTFFKQPSQMLKWITVGFLVGGLSFGVAAGIQASQSPVPAQAPAR